MPPKNKATSENTFNVKTTHFSLKYKAQMSINKSFIRLFKHLKRISLIHLMLL